MSRKREGGLEREMSVKKKEEEEKRLELGLRDLEIKVCFFNMFFWFLFCFRVFKFSLF